jgi:hypothetical protein
MPTVHFHHITLLLIAQKAAQRAADDATRPNALPEDALIAIVMAAMAAEAFVNELAEYLHVLRDAQADWDPISPALLACADAIKKVEAERGSLKQKYMAASSALGHTFDKAAPPFKNFAELVDVRNAIVHLKPSDTRGLAGTDALAERGLAHSKTATSGLPWLDRLLNPKTAAWAVQAAQNVMLAILAMIPGHEPAELDPMNILRQLLRDNPAFAGSDP